MTFARAGQACGEEAIISVLREFKKFAMRGNVIDLAMGVIVGGAFGKIVTSLVNDMLMPPIGLLVGRMDFSNLYIPLGGRGYGSLAEAKQAGAPVIAYGLFVNQVLDFVIIAFAIFLIVRQINRLRAKGEPLPATTRDCPYCLSSIPLKATRCAHCTSEV